MTKEITEVIICTVRGKDYKSIFTRMPMSRAKTISNARERIEYVIKTADNILAMLRRVSLYFKTSYSSAPTHNPYYLHSTKLNGIILRLEGALAHIEELFHSKVNEKNLNLTIAPNVITEGGEYILQNLIPLISNEYHKIQCLIIIVDKDGYYNKSIATQIIQTFPKGSSGRAIITKALYKEGRIPSERATSRLMKWYETRLKGCEMSQPIIEQSWHNKRGRKRKAINSGKWMGSLFVDIHPIKMRREKSQRITHTPK
jgi:hypothetical protein